MNRRKLLAALGAIAARPAWAQGAARLSFTAIPDQDETRLVERFGRVATYLQAKLGVLVDYVPVKSYPAAVTALTNNQVQLAWFGGFTGVQARRAVPGSDAIAQGCEDPTFKSFFIANARTGIATSSDFPAAIAGRCFTFGARATNSVRVMPDFYIRKQFNKSPDEVFSRVGFSGDHTRTLQLVQSGAFEAGAMDYSVFELERQAGRVDPAQVSVVWATPPFPDYNWTLRAGVDAAFGAGFRERLRSALTDCLDEAIVGQFGRTGFIPAANADYAPIQQVAQVTGLLN